MSELNKRNAGVGMNSIDQDAAIEDLRERMVRIEELLGIFKETETRLERVARFYGVDGLPSLKWRDNK